MSGCEHYACQQDTAINDGHCPICQQAEIERLRLDRDQRTAEELRLRRELAEARAIIDKVEEIAVNNRTGCGTCTTVVNLVVSYASDQPDEAV